MINLILKSYRTYFCTFLLIFSTSLYSQILDKELLPDSVSQDIVEIINNFNESNVNNHCLDDTGVYAAIVLNEMGGIKNTLKNINDILLSTSNNLVGLNQYINSSEVYIMQSYLVFKNAGKYISNTIFKEWLPTTLDFAMVIENIEAATAIYCDCIYNRHKALATSLRLKKMFKKFKLEYNLKLNNEVKLCKAINPKNNKVDRESRKLCTRAAFKEYKQNLKLDKKEFDYFQKDLKDMIANSCGLK